MVLHFLDAGLALFFRVFPFPPSLFDSQETLMEVVEGIKQWVGGSVDLGDVIDLINSWADPVRHPSN